MRSRAFWGIIALAVTWQIHADAAKAMSDLATEIDRSVCRELKAASKGCHTEFEGTTQNEINPTESLWAFSFVLPGEGVTTRSETESVKAALLALKAAPLDLAKNRVSGVAYFREKNGILAKIAPEDFHRLALNPWSNVVVRYDSNFLKAGSVLKYHVPDIWKKEGIATSTTSPVTLSGTFRGGKHLVIEIASLDDKPLPGIVIAGCSSAGTGSCNAEAISVGSDGVFKIDLQIRAGRNFKSDQPAFKIIVKSPQSEKPLAQLAIPFKPRPNYFLFGVTGFLFGGLIAVMMLFMRRRQKQPVHIP